MWAAMKSISLGDAVGASVFDAIAALAEALSAFDLHAPENAKKADQDVVRFAFSPRTGDGETEGGGAGEEFGFGGFAETLAAGSSDEVRADGGCGCAGGFLACGIWV